MASNTDDMRTARPQDGAIGSSGYRRWRRFKDGMARYVVVAGGLSVIAALLLIFCYLFYVVLPLFQGADAEPVASYAAPGEAATLGVALNEYADIGVRFGADASVIFFATDTGKVLQQERAPLPEGVSVTGFASASPQSRTVALGLSDGRVLVLRHSYKFQFIDGSRHLTPRVEYPLGTDPVALNAAGEPVRRLALQVDDERATLAGLGAGGKLSLLRFAREESFLTGDVTWELERFELEPVAGKIEQLLLGARQDRLYLLQGGRELLYLDISNPESTELVQRALLAEGKERVTSIAFLTGGNSLLVGTSNGRISQWFPVREEGGEQLRLVRTFAEQDAPIVAIDSEQGRRGFLAADASGRVGVYHSTAHRVLMVEQVANGPLPFLAVAPRTDAVLAQEESGRLHFVALENPHPEISWSALWGRVWYEGYERPDFVWQSSSASNDFEPKFSLTPLSFGTLKAALYAMLFAVPLGIMGAIYTAYFMAPRMRRYVKPTVEIMEALPTVILGFLAGLWLAPLVEDKLPGFFAMFLVVPLGVLLFAYAWSRLPVRLRSSVPEGWQAALLIPVIVLLGALALGLSPVLEEMFFGGNIRTWLTHDLGIDYDQRNALVVGMAMGFAVIPTIFSIAEDAIFSVPKHLTFGALALGSTTWQALSRVVLLTASPGIFSAVMIGLGRAVGETMIVLMATGNTPIMDWNVFEGMRTLSANIAVEMPESEVGSSHYRVLFLAGLVLFIFTFAFNTVAELVRQRLRRKYSSL